MFYYFLAVYINGSLMMADLFPLSIFAKIFHKLDRGKNRTQYFVLYLFYRISREMFLSEFIGAFC